PRWRSGGIGFCSGGGRGGGAPGGRGRLVGGGEQKDQTEGRGGRPRPPCSGGGGRRTPPFSANGRRRRKRRAQGWGQPGRGCAPGVSDPRGGPQRRAPACSPGASPRGDQRTAGRPDRRLDSTPSDLRLSGAVGAVALSGGNPHYAQDRVSHLHAQGLVCAPTG